MCNGLFTVGSHGAQAPERKCGALGISYVLNGGDAEHMIAAIDRVKMGLTSKWVYCRIVRMLMVY
eukprot:4562930-Amphidinium_carterae.1